MCPKGPATVFRELRESCNWRKYKLLRVCVCSCEEASWLSSNSSRSLFPLQTTRNVTREGHSADPNARRNRACEDLGWVEEKIREGKAKLIEVIKRQLREFGGQTRAMFKQVHEGNGRRNRILKSFLGAHPLRIFNKDKNFVVVLAKTSWGSPLFQVTVAQIQREGADTCEQMEEGHKSVWFTLKMKSAQVRKCTQGHTDFLVSFPTSPPSPPPTHTHTNVYCASHVNDHCTLHSTGPCPHSFSFEWFPRSYTLRMSFSMQGRNGPYKPNFT